MNIRGLNSDLPERRAGGSPGCWDQVKSGWNSIPIFTKTILTLCFGIYVTTWFIKLIPLLGSIANSLILMPNKLLDFQVWRLITIQYVHP